MPRNFLCALLVLGMAGCGYTTGSLLPKNYRTIAVEPFVNQVNNTDETTSGQFYVPGLETNVTSAIVDRFLFDGNLHIASPDKANLIMTGALIGIAQDTLRQDVNQNVQEYRLRIVVSITVTDPLTHKVILTEPSFTGETTYFLTGPGAESQSAAIQDALTDLASRVVDRTIENW